MSHSEEKPFKCVKNSTNKLLFYSRACRCSKEGCDAAFSVAYNLKRHEKRHELPNPYHVSIVVLAVCVVLEFSIVFVYKLKAYFHSCYFYSVKRMDVKTLSGNVRNY